MSSTNKTSPFDGATNHLTADGQPVARAASPATPAVLIRKLPRNTTLDSLNSMLLFAKDLISADFVDSKDAGFLTALAKFHSDAGAREARAMLNGKQNFTKDASMIVEIVSDAATPEGARRATHSGTSKSPEVKGLPAAAQGPWQPSRYNETFQALERVSSPPTNNQTSDGVKLDGHSYFMPAASMAQPLGRQSNTGKSVIGQDLVDDETGKILDDPMSFLNNDLVASSGLGTSVGGPPGRRQTLPHIPVSRFAHMSLNGNGTGGMASPPPPMAGMISPRLGTLQSPNAYASNTNMASMGPNGYQYSPQNFLRPSFPPINPSDQNPPCNTLYVGNLPMDASEDELKALFCKQRGYKRLCLRTKANGPMCFVEFEDIPCASKALTECYGMPLHNSTKGGIRLSFSKNPLGVRNGQPGSMTGPSALSPQGPMPGMSGMTAFSAVNGPPPGLNPPPGLMGLGLNGGSSSGGSLSLHSPNGTPSSNGFPNPLMSPIGTSSGQSMRTPTSTIGQGWNWPTRESNRDVPASMMGR